MIGHSQWVEQKGVKAIESMRVSPRKKGKHSQHWQIM